MSEVESSRVALLLPGRGYTVDHPALYYAAEVARELGWRADSVSWDATDLSDQQVVAHGRAAVSALRPDRDVVIGKSLGSLLLPDAVDRGVPGVWLTPLLHRDEIRASVLQGIGPALLVGGSADESWDSGLAHQSGHVVHELRGGDHRLQLPGDAVGSARFLVSLVEQVRSFLVGLS
ncbi:hypothetical protein KUV85_16325 [Nocardioides panacisoli]|uniref:hypothetical protein n=1 Tax=Nocardioides panacisoli TaxID=627624 RepID=UPI001C62DAF3|nr:hypothetical protein [Nocardioides panacisoli]QYJ03867.1 hypothetical protein KUV85_16325 [Nocardioides panacisoli]